MAGLKEVRERIASVKSTQQITKAMKLVAASKLKRATNRITQMRPYAEKLQDVMNNIMAKADMSSLSLDFNNERPVESLLLVIFTSDRGLCGGFNSNLIKTAKALIADKYPNLNPKSQITLLPVGKKGKDAFKNSGMRIIDDFVGLFQDLNFENAAKVADYATNGFLEGDYDAVEVVYSRFKNAATQIFEQEKYLPISNTAEETETANSEYIYEPSQGELLTELLPKILRTSIFKFALDSNASEHGARMVAMDSATNNASDLIRDLEIDYNKARQAAITNQITEIVGGAAALES